MVMGQEQFGQIERVLGVVLGAAGDEGSTEFLKRDGIDGVERDPIVGFQEGDEMDGGLFQSQADTGLGLLLAEFPQPFPERFGRGVNGMVWDRRWPVAWVMRCRSAFLSERSRPMIRS